MQAYLNDSGFEVGQPYWQLGPLVPPDWLFPIQAIFLYLGLFGSLVVAFQIAVSHYKNRNIALRAFLPWGILSLLMLVAALWIMFQPMEMRGTIFKGCSKGAITDLRYIIDTLWAHLMKIVGTLELIGTYPTSSYPFQ